MVIDEIYKMTVKGVKLKSESFFSISHGVLELWRKNIREGADSAPLPGMDKVKNSSGTKIIGKNFSNKT